MQSIEHTNIDYDYSVMSTKFVKCISVKLNCVFLKYVNVVSRLSLPHDEKKKGLVLFSTYRTCCEASNAAAKLQ